MKKFTAQDATDMVKNLDRFINETHEFMKVVGYQPQPGAQAITDTTTHQRPESVQTAYSQGVFLVDVAADHLMAFVRSVTEPVQTVAPWSCVRSLLEASALAVWFLDPALDLRSRVARSFAFRYAGLEQQLKLIRLRGDQVLTAQVVKRIDEVEQVALSLGYARVTDRKGNRIGIGDRMPSITEIIREMLDKEFEYRLLSAMAHGHHWAIQKLGYRLIKDDDDMFAGAEAGWHNSSLLEKHQEPTLIGYLCSTAVTAYTKPLRFLFQIYGWDTDQAISLLNENCDRLRIRPEHRCWVP